MRQGKFGAALLLSVILSSCAGVDFRSIPYTTADTADKEANGFRYYDTSPFLLVYTDGKGGLTSSVLYLPDTTKLRTVHPFAYGAKNDTTLTFDNGRLAQSKSVVDETVIPKAVLSALEKVGTAMAKAANAKEAKPEALIPTPYLFRIIYDGNKWELRGGFALGADGTEASIRYVAD
ncbi:MAG: hypothetical protein ABL931_01380 [Usitatibacteraceae bacterium]